MKSVITVPLPDRSYDVVITPGGLDHVGSWLAGIAQNRTAGTPKMGKKILLVSNPTVFERYGERAIASLKNAGFDIASCLLPDGEQYKHLDSIQTVYDAALNHRIERSSTLVSLGGGVIGDMTGFAAATWLRGVNFVQIPTTLLAMVDASIGGKTGVNHPRGKNLIGAFYQPRLVVLDPEVLQTLPSREFRAGMAEVIKYGVIWDADLFEELERASGISDHDTLPAELLQTILTRSCQAKADVVSQDEKEAGLRAILNYGHTIGHAVESLTGYTSIIHGEGVAIGMVAAGQIAVELGRWDAKLQQRQIELIQKTKLPTQIPTTLDPSEIVATLQTDKKVEDGRVKFILPYGLGHVDITKDVPSEVVLNVVKTLQV
ncbi:MAG: 3-dehydroquinate synthase [Leptolyngbyaceae bacterium]|nr:3-dehydroquinate synthase [Leptolyngbyaceae bacterium]